MHVNPGYSILSMTTGEPSRGARIQSIRSGRRDEVLVETYEAGAGLRRWVVSVDAEDARWLEAFPGPEPTRDTKASAPRPRHSATPSAEPAFVLLLRARIEGGHVRAYSLT